MLLNKFPTPRQVKAYTRFNIAKRRAMDCITNNIQSPTYYHIIDDFKYNTRIVIINNPSELKTIIKTKEAITRIESPDMIRKFFLAGWARKSGASLSLLDH